MSFNKERFNAYETKNWSEYQKYMEERGYKLLEKTETEKTNDSYYDLMFGDGKWIKDGVISFRDFKCGGSKFNFPVSKRSLKSFTSGGYYDFMNIVSGNHEFFLVPKLKVIELYESGKWYQNKEIKNGESDLTKGLIRFYYKDIKTLSE